MYYHVFRLIDGSHTYETMSRCLGTGLRELEIIERAHGLSPGDLICFRANGRDDWKILTTIANEVMWKSPLPGDVFATDVSELTWDASYATHLNKFVDDTEYSLGVR